MAISVLVTGPVQRGPDLLLGAAGKAATLARLTDNFMGKKFAGSRHELMIGQTAFGHDRVKGLTAQIVFKVRHATIDHIRR